MHMSIHFIRMMLEAYTEGCKPLCQEMQIPQTAFDILMFLANNPTYKTARDIVAVRGLKANLVSINVDRLVQEGFLERIPDQKDRRKTILNCTKRAWPIVERGRQFQQTFLEHLFEGVEEAELAAFGRVMEQVKDNLAQAQKEGQSKWNC